MWRLPGQPLKSYHDYAWTSWQVYFMNNSKKIRFFQGDTGISAIELRYFLHNNHSNDNINSDINNDHNNNNDDDDNECV